MNWIDSNDKTEPIISAKRHIRSSHGKTISGKIRETVVLFEVGYAIPLLKEKYPLKEIIKELPCFLHREECVHIEGFDNVSFVQGGFGAPAAVDVLETVLALGAKKIIVVGFCGGFADNLKIGDLIIPDEIKREEGTSYHYLSPEIICQPDLNLYRSISKFLSNEFKTILKKTVSVDGIYRQTIQKEKQWLKSGYVGVDMESSAILSVCQFYNIPAACVLMVSDVHHLDGPKEWIGKLMT